MTTVVMKKRQPSMLKMPQMWQVADFNPIINLQNKFKSIEKLYKHTTFSSKDGFVRILLLMVKSFLHSFCTKLRFTDDSALLAQMSEFSSCASNRTFRVLWSQQRNRCVYRQSEERFLLFTILNTCIKRFLIIILDPLRNTFWNILVLLDKVVVSEIAHILSTS